MEVFVEQEVSEVTDDFDNYEEDDYEEELGEETYTLRCKWQLDGVSTMDEAIERMYQFIEHLKDLRAEGFEFSQPMEDDYGLLVKQF